MSNAVIYNKETKKVLKRYPTLKGALAAYSRAWNRAHTRLLSDRLGKIAGVPVDKALASQLVVMTEEHYEEHCNPTVIVTNLMTGNPVKIRQSEVGGPCDPSTERYWSM